jgi:hypothetical protein
MMGTLSVLYSIRNSVLNLSLFTSPYINGKFAILTQPGKAKVEYNFKREWWPDRVTEKLLLLAPICFLRLCFSFTFYYSLLRNNKISTGINCHMTLFIKCLTQRIYSCVKYYHIVRVRSHGVEI